MPSLVFILFLLVGAYGQEDDGDIIDVSTLPPPGTCQPITRVTMCRYVNWTNASFPNLRQQTTQEEAESEIVVFIPVVRSLCSNAIVHLLCSVYTPFCMTNPQGDPVTLEPCRELCEYVRRDCEPLFLMNDFEWPPQFECSQFPSNQSAICLNIPVESVKIPTIPGIVSPPDPTPSSSATSSVSISHATTSSFTVTPTPTPNSNTSAVNDMGCPPSLSLSNHPLNNSKYVFAGIDKCAVNCTGIYFNHVESNVVAPTFVLVCALICIIFTLFTVGTFLIDRQRYHYPERPVIFLALCYLAISLAYFIGSAVKLANPKAAYACSDTEGESYVFQRLPDATPTFHSAVCVVLFIVIYYFQMAASIWWVVLTLTWFLASTLKWGEEAVQRPWVLYHIVSWCVPAIQVILVLALELVDGDQLSGVCYTGNHNSVGLGVFVFLPLAFYLVLGTVFLVIGFGSLVNIRLQISDSNKSRRLQRLIIRILVYSLLYIVPNFIYLCFCLYELAEKNQWEEDYIKSRQCGESCDSITSPTYAALLLRYLMLFMIGIFSTFWVISWKTIVAWKKFFISIFCCRQERHYDLPKKETAL